MTDAALAEVEVEVEVIVAAVVAAGIFSREEQLGVRDLHAAGRTHGMFVVSLWPW